MLISLFISFTVDPMLSARLAKQRKPGEVMIHTGVARFFHEMFLSWERFYESVLRWVLANKWKTVGVTVAVLVVSLGAATQLGAEFASVEDHDQLIADLKLPDSASLDLSARRALEAEALLRKIPEVTDIYSIIGTNGEVNKVRLRALLVPKKTRAKKIERCRRPRWPSPTRR